MPKLHASNTKIISDIRLTARKVQLTPTHRGYHKWKSLSFEPFSDPSSRTDAFEDKRPLTAFNISFSEAHGYKDLGGFVALIPLISEKVESNLLVELAEYTSVMTQRGTVSLVMDLLMWSTSFNQFYVLILKTQVLPSGKLVFTTEVTSPIMPQQFFGAGGFLTLWVLLAIVWLVHLAAEANAARSQIGELTQGKEDQGSTLAFDGKKAGDQKQTAKAISIYKSFKALCGHNEAWSKVAGYLKKDLRFLSLLTLLFMFIYLCLAAKLNRLQKHDIALYAQSEQDILRREAATDGTLTNNVLSLESQFARLNNLACFITVLCIVRLARLLVKTMDKKLNTDV